MLVRGQGEEDLDHVGAGEVLLEELLVDAKAVVLGQSPLEIGLDLALRQAQQRGRDQTAEGGDDPPGPPGCQAEQPVQDGAEPVARRRPTGRDAGGRKEREHDRHQRHRQQQRHADAEAEHQAQLAKDGRGHQRERDETDEGRGRGQQAGHAHLAGAVANRGVAGFAGLQLDQVGRPEVDHVRECHDQHDRRHDAHHDVQVAVDHRGQAEAPDHRDHRHAHRDGHRRQPPEHREDHQQQHAGRQRQQAQQVEVGLVDDLAEQRRQSGQTQLLGAEAGGLELLDRLSHQRRRPLDRTAGVDRQLDVHRNVAAVLRDQQAPGQRVLAQLRGQRLDLLRIAPRRVDVALDDGQATDQTHAHGVEDALDATHALTPLDPLDDGLQPGQAGR